MAHCGITPPSFRCVAAVRVSSQTIHETTRGTPCLFETLLKHEGSCVRSCFSVRLINW